MTALLVVLGGVAGGAVRYVVGRRLDGRIHAGTLLVNVVASLILGALAHAAVSGHLLALLGTGFCGALSTYSSVAVQAVDHDDRRLGAAYAVGTVLVCLLAAWLGWSLVG